MVKVRVQVTHIDQGMASVRIMQQTSRQRMPQSIFWLVF